MYRRLITYGLLLACLALVGSAHADSWVAYCDDGTTRQGTFNPGAQPASDPCLTSSPAQPAPQPAETWREVDAGEPQRETARAEPADKTPTLPPLRPANIGVSTTGGLTTIAWAEPLNPDDAHCPIACYAVAAVDLADDSEAWDSGDVYTQVVTTERLKPGIQYDLEVSAYSADCDAWSEPGVYTYQY